MLPFKILDDIALEEVKFQDGVFDTWSRALDEYSFQELKSVRHALVWRFAVERYPVEVAHGARSEEDLHLVAALLRLIRPTRSYAHKMHGSIVVGDKFYVQGFDHPSFVEVPEVQKNFAIRTSDAELLREYAPRFLAAMRGDFWKFRMAVEFHESGYFQLLPSVWKPRFLMWCSAIESIFTSHDHDHRGSPVAKSRIKWFLGEGTSIYPPGDMLDFLDDPQITVGAIVDHLYEMRNIVAHGDKIPDDFVYATLRQGLNGDVRRREVLVEAASFIVRASLLKILRDNLMENFADAASANRFFGAHKLTKNDLRGAKRQKP